MKDAAGHDIELGIVGIVHDAVAGVVRHVLLQHLFGKPSDAGGQAGQSGRIHDRLHKLVVRHDTLAAFYFQINKLVSLPASLA